MADSRPTTPTRRIKASDVYLAAARMIERGESLWSCCAIADVMQPGHSTGLGPPALQPQEQAILDQYLAWFADDAHREYPARDSFKPVTSFQLAIEGGNHRVLLLCMAYTLAKEQEKR